MGRVYRARVVLFGRFPLWCIASRLLLRGCIHLWLFGFVRSKYYLRMLGPWASKLQSLDFKTHYCLDLFFQLVYSGLAQCFSYLLPGFNFFGALTVTTFTMNLIVGIWLPVSYSRAFFSNFYLITAVDTAMIYFNYFSSYIFINLYNVLVRLVRTK